MLECKDKIFYYRGTPVFGSVENQRLAFAKYKNMTTAVFAHECCADAIAQRIYDDYFVVLNRVEIAWMTNSMTICVLQYDEYDEVMTKWHKENGQYGKYLKMKSAPADIDRDKISKKWVEFCENNGL